MKIASLRQLVQHEDINFLLTNRIPRRMLTLLAGRFSQIRSPALCRLSIAVWRLFTDLDLWDARQQSFNSLHECFTRQLKPGARPVCADPAVLVSPSDGIVGACGRISDGMLLQAKGMPYSMKDLLGQQADTGAFAHGVFVTLRLTSAMYHRFHAPDDCVVEHVTYHSGDTWNVNPIALARVERLFCRNERAVLWTRLEEGGQRIALVPVAAILVASIRLHFLDVLLHLRYKGAHEVPCHARHDRGQEMGWFQHGSTIIVLAPKGFTLADGVGPGARVRVGVPLLNRPAADAAQTHHHGDVSPKQDLRVNESAATKSGAVIR